MSQPPRSILGVIAAVAISFAVLTYALSFVLAALGITTTALGPDLLSLNGLLPLEAFLLLIPRVVPANGLLLVVVSMTIFAVCLWAAAKDRGGFLQGLKTLTRKSKPVTTPNWLVIMPMIASFLLIMTFILSIVLNSIGASVGSLPSNNRTQLFASVAFAPVGEEIGFRISVLGLLVAIRTLWQYYGSLALARLVRIARAISSTIRSPRKAAEAIRKIPHMISDEIKRIWGLDRRILREPAFRVTRRTLLALASPDRAKDAAGLPSISGSGWHGISPSEWALLLVSSSWFGILHSLSGAGWGPGKALTAGLSGFALGIVYLWYGAYASILLHWFFDFYNFVVFQTLLGGILPILLADLSILDAFFLSVVGLVFGFRWLLPRKSTLGSPTISYIPPQP